jgi:hypothetical protein
MTSNNGYPVVLSDQRLFTLLLNDITLSHKQPLLLPWEFLAPFPFFMEVWTLSGRHLARRNFTLL